MAKAPKPKTPIVKPPRARRWESEYKLRVTGLWRHWSDHVIHAAQAAMAQNGTRADSIDDELRSTFGALLEDIAKQIQERVQIGARHARLIARDQTNKFNGDAQQATQTRAGITQYRWSTAQDEAVRGRPGGEYAKSKENHWALQGTIQDWSNAPRIPGTNEHSHPGGRIQCRCVAVPVVPWL